MLLPLQHKRRRKENCLLIQPGSRTFEFQSDHLAKSGDKKFVTAKKLLQLTTTASAELQLSHCGSFATAQYFDSSPDSCGINKLLRDVRCAYS
jgi:hypothetical protein